MGGVRYLRLEDDSFATVPAVAGPIGFEVENDLVGFQLGAEVLVLSTDATPINLTATGKAGIYGVESQSRFTVVDPTVPVDVQAEADEAALVAELGFVASWPVSPVLSLQVSYHLLWLEGVAVAGDQYASSVALPPPGSTVLNHGGAFFHGFNFGVISTW